MTSMKGFRSASSPSMLTPKGAESLDVASHGRQNEPPSSGLRLVERPRGPRPNPAEQTDLHTSESAQVTEQISQPNTSSSSEFSSDTWDFKDRSSPSELERPPTVFTGEYRTRSLIMSPNSTSSPTLRIAASADSLIMGGNARKESKAATASHSTPSLLQRFSNKLTPSTPKATGSQEDVTSGSKVSAASENTPTRNFCRPQLSLDNLAKGDISGKEMSVSRKPVSKLSFNSLSSPRSKSMRPAEEPVVPKIPDQYAIDQGSNLRQISSGSTGPETPNQATAKSNDAGDTETEATPAPKTAIRHPPRASSLQASSNLASGSGAAASMKRNVTFSDLSPLTSHIEHVGQTPSKAKLPESKSTNFVLESLRRVQVFGRARKEDLEAPTPSKENEDPYAGKSVAKGTLPRHDSEKSLKLKGRHSRFSVGVRRKSKDVSESPGTPTPSAPRLLAPANRGNGEASPTFARDTQSTRIRASYAPRGKASTTPDSQSRQPLVSTSSSGSPHRLAGTKGTPSKSIIDRLPLRPAQKKANDKPTISSPVPVSQAMPSASEGSTEGLPKNLDAFRDCVDGLCQKIVTSTDLAANERHIRLALQLQQHIGDYRKAEELAIYAERFAQQTRMDRRRAEENLNLALAEAQAQLEMD
ncbi:hypothetical protein BDV18DRAFT_131569 [Aspergillus unguis]